MSALVRLFAPGIGAIAREQGVVEELREQAEAVRERALASFPLGQSPNHADHLRIEVSSGVNRRGQAFAQVRMFDDLHPAGATVTEYGSVNNAPLAPLRKALR